MEWRTIPEYPKYEASSNGDIRNKRTGKIVKQFKNNKGGYLIIGIYGDGTRVTKTVHRLIASAYLPDYSNDRHVDHINRYRSDNKPSNLRMATAIQNANNRIRSVGEIEHIINLYKSGYTAEQIRESFA